jgi:hypothetical protein
MFEKSEERDRRIAAVVSAFLDIPRGKSITHRVLGNLIDCRPQSDAYYCIMDSVKKRMLKVHGLELHAVVGVGYRAYQPREQVYDATITRLRSIGRKHRKTKKSLDAVRPSELSERDNEARVKLADRADSEATENRRSARLLGVLMRGVKQEVEA